MNIDLLVVGNKFDVIARRDATNDDTKVDTRAVRCPHVLFVLVLQGLLLLEEFRVSAGILHARFYLYINLLINRPIRSRHGLFCNILWRVLRLSIQRTLLLLDARANKLVVMRGASRASRWHRRPTLVHLLYRTVLGGVLTTKEIG